MKVLFNNFLRGLLLVFPVGATIYIIYSAINWADGLLNNLLFEPVGVDIPGLGLLTVFLGVAFLGYLFTRAFTRPLVYYFENLLSRVPFVKLIYTSIKELTEAFVGEKKRFNQPVIVRLTEEGLIKPGFITDEDLSNFGLEDEVAVYCPHSYNFSGNLFFVKKEQLTPVDLNSIDVMKYIVSAGVTDIKRTKS